VKLRAVSGRIVRRLRRWARRFRSVNTVRRGILRAILEDVGMRRTNLPSRLARAVRRGTRRLVVPDAGRPAAAPTASPTHLDDGRPAMNVLFLGGTGRSGTSITARLIGEHAAYHRIPIETKFLVAPGGLTDLVRGLTTYAEFEESLLGQWFETGAKNGAKRGLRMIMTREDLEAALPILRDGLAVDPWAAGRRFTHTLFDPIAREAGKPGWIEKFPANVRDADILYQLFPNMRLVHLVRDGRDVALSVQRFPWGPDDVDEALDWWAIRLERGFAACDRTPAERILTIQMEDLVAHDRVGQYRRLLDFLELEDDRAMRTYFEENVTEAQSHIGRWREEVPQERIAAFDAHHERLAAGFRERARPYVPAEAEPAPVG
jgi:hypothetical protein